MKLGTVQSILTDVAEYLQIERQELIRQLFS